MNKFFLAIFFFLALSTASAGGFDSFLNKLNDGLEKFNTKTNEIADTVNKYAGATEKTLNIASNIVDTIVTDLKTVSEDVKTLGKSLETEFNALYSHGMKIVEKTTTFVNAGYKDAQSLYKDSSKQLTSLIASAQADIDRAVATAKTTIAQLSSDVRIVYSNGKIVAQQVTDAADLTTAVANVKAKNKEALEETIKSINAALAEGNAIIATANASLKKYQTLATQYTSDAKTGAKKIVAEMQTFVAAATKQLETFKKNQEKTLKEILADAQDLYKSSKDILSQATSALDKAVDLYNKNADAVKAGKTEIESTWSKESLANQSSATGDLSKITDTIKQAQTTVAGLTDEGKKVTTVISTTGTTLTDVSKTVTDELKNIKFKVTADTLNVRNGPSTSNKVVDVLKKNDIVTVSSQSGKWSQIGTDRWVSATYLTIADTTAAKESANKISETITSTLNSLKSLFSSIGK